MDLYRGPAMKKSPPRQAPAPAAGSEETDTHALRRVAKGFDIDAWEPSLLERLAGKRRRQRKS
jgi:hypothetical protein